MGNYRVSPLEWLCLFERSCSSNSGNKTTGRLGYPGTIYCQISLGKRLLRKLVPELRAMQYVFRPPDCELLRMPGLRPLVSKPLLHKDYFPELYEKSDVFQGIAQPLGKQLTTLVFSSLARHSKPLGKMMTGSVRGNAEPMIALTDCA